MKIIQGSSIHQSDQSLSSPALFFQGPFSKIKILIMLVPFYIFIFTFFVTSFLSLPVIHEESFFYPFSPGSDKTIKTFDFVFKRFCFYHRFLQLDCAFVRHHEGPLPTRKMMNHVTQHVFLGKVPNIFIENRTDVEYDQEIIFKKDDYQSNTYSFYLDENFAYPFINLSFIYETNFSEIAGFNFKFSQGNFNVQFLSAESQKFLFFITLFLLYTNLRSTSIRNTTAYKLILILEILSCLSLNPLYTTFTYPFLKLPIPLFICAFFFSFRLFSIYLLEVTLASGHLKIRSFIKSMKTFISIYSFFELKEIYDRYLFVFHPNQTSRFTIFNCLMICFHFTYFIFGIKFCLKLIENQKNVTTFHITWSFYIILVVYCTSLFTSFCTNVLLAIFWIRPIIDSIAPVMIYRFSMHISVFIYHQITMKYAVELENYFYKLKQSLNEGDSFLADNIENVEN
ncbi:hypothetical protein M9Y10_032858 [Tritrichomonas musculus]|uniref:Uncharacterized protein n=1 Tax=Tritrichomonas musculus TaxID=1915356 RepID=A0ABR2GY06_9EUKA